MIIHSIGMPTELRSLTLNNKFVICVAGLGSKGIPVMESFVALVYLVGCGK